MLGNSANSHSLRILTKERAATKKTNARTTDERTASANPLAKADPFLYVIRPSIKSLGVVRAKGHQKIVLSAHISQISSPAP